MEIIAEAGRAHCLCFYPGQSSNWRDLNVLRGNVDSSHGIRTLPPLSVRSDQTQWASGNPSQDRTAFERLPKLTLLYRIRAMTPILDHLAMEATTPPHKMHWIAWAWIQRAHQAPCYRHLLLRLLYPAFGWQSSSHAVGASAGSIRRNHIWEVFQNSGLPWNPFFRVFKERHWFGML